MIARSSVDLPQPLPPTSANISPGCTVEADVLVHHGRTIAGAQVADVDHGVCVLAVVSLRHSQIEPVED